MMKWGVDTPDQNGVLVCYHLVASVICGLGFLAVNNCLFIYWQENYQDIYMQTVSKFSDFILYTDDSQLYKSVSPNIEEDQLTAVMHLQNCVSQIYDWMNWNKLKINEDKTEFLMAGTSRQHAKVLFDSLSVSGTIILAISCVKNLGVIDKELTLNNDITYICKSPAIII